MPGFTNPQSAPSVICQFNRGAVGRTLIWWVFQVSLVDSRTTYPRRSFSHQQHWSRAESPGHGWRAAGEQARQTRQGRIIHTSYQGSLGNKTARLVKLRGDGCHRRPIAATKASPQTCLFRHGSPWMACEAASAIGPPVSQHTGRLAAAT